MMTKCMLCDWEVFALQNSSSKNLVSDHRTIFAALAIRPNSKFHFNVIDEKQKLTNRVSVFWSIPATFLTAGLTGLGVWLFMKKSH